MQAGARLESPLGESHLALTAAMSARVLPTRTLCIPVSPPRSLGAAAGRVHRARGSATDGPGE